MIRATGPIRKMLTTPGESGAPVQYRLPIGGETLPVNPLLGTQVRFRHTGRIFCIHCGQATRTSFAQGYCFSCMQSLAQCDICIVRPETCHYHLGTCREPAWGEAHCFIEHTVYLANSSGLKVGITRSHQMRTRWMDQGAVQALPIVRVTSRRDSGLVESALAKVVPDKTNWRAMLKGEAERIDLEARRDQLFAAWAADLPGEKLLAEEFRLVYPVRRYPAKVASFNLDKEPEVKGELLGVKGQYLLFDTGVINMRKYAGYELEWDDEAGEVATDSVASGAGAADSGSTSPAVAPPGKTPLGKAPPAAIQTRDASQLELL